MFDKIKHRLKNSWLLGAFAIVALILWNTNVLFQNLKKEERAKMELWAMAQQEFIENSVLSNLTFKVLQQTWNNPMVLVDGSGEIIGHKNLDWEPETNDSLEIFKLLKNIKKENNPIFIRYQDSISDINQKLYYGDSILLKKLQYYPLALLLIIFLFGAVLYFVFKTSKISDQNRLWAGMAKETAHQIGTPLSSLLGWIAILKMENADDKYVDEIEKDVHRLNTIANRFSKIGSLPTLKKLDIIAVTKNAYEYLEYRSSKQISFSFNTSETNLYSTINDELYSWVIENLIKNAIDAMLGKGELAVAITADAKKIKIDITDTGKGMAKSQFKKIFKPGFTTKKRGWGLGLSLSKRIIEDYHKGKIVVKNSEINKGTTFQIVLDKIS